MRTEVGERIVGDELVVVACHEEVARADFWIEAVELVHLAPFAGPFVSVLGALHLHWDALCQVVVEVDDDRDGDLSS